ncbi:Riboflavin transporter MCH5 [Leucoagaricus sp. SymC.cos]|nr:Riboflavin transporter MCH5 [Leucoagaricus sp. SymC.cos]
MASLHGTPESNSEKPRSLDAAPGQTEVYIIGGEDNSPRFDGGLRAWANIVGGCLALTTTFGYANSFGVFQDIYTRSHAASTSAVSWIGSTQLFLLLSMSLPAGKLLDKGYFRQTFLAGSLIYVFSLFMVSLAHPDKYYQIYLSQGIGMGVGAGLLYTPSVAVQAHYWRRKRAMAMGIVASGTSIGGVIFPIMLNRLFSNSVGFAWGVRASAFLVLGLLIPANLLMSDRPLLKKEPRPKPNMKAILTDVPYIIAVIAGFFIQWGLYFPFFYLQLYSILHGVDPNTAFYTITMLNAGSIPGRILPAILADYIGPYNAAVPCIVGLAVLSFALFGIHTAAGIIVFALLYGFTSGACGCFVSVCLRRDLTSCIVLSLCAPAIAVYAKTQDELGIRFGIMFFVSSFGTLVGNPAIGALLGNTFSWWKAFIFSGVSKFIVVIRNKNV